MYLCMCVCLFALYVQLSSYLVLFPCDLHCTRCQINPCYKLVASCNSWQVIGCPTPRNKSFARSHLQLVQLFLESWSDPSQIPLRFFCLPTLLPVCFLLLHITLICAIYSECVFLPCLIRLTVTTRLRCGMQGNFRKCALSLVQVRISLHHQSRVWGPVKSWDAA